MLEFYTAVVRQKRLYIRRDRSVSPSSANKFPAYEAPKAHPLQNFLDPIPGLPDVATISHFIPLNTF
jgi:hypothetical protein